MNLVGEEDSQDSLSKDLFKLPSNQVCSFICMCLPCIPCILPREYNIIHINPAYKKWIKIGQIRADCKERKGKGENDVRNLEWEGYSTGDQFSCGLSRLPK